MVTEKQPRAIKRNRRGLTLATVSFRPTAAAREIIDSAARASGRTVAGQINFLIENATEVETRTIADCKRAFGGAASFALGYVVARSVVGIEHERQHPWNEGTEARALVAKLLRGLATLIEEHGQTSSSIAAKRLRDMGPNLKPRENMEPYRAMLTRVEEQLGGKSDSLYWPLADAAPSGSSAKLVPTADEIRQVLSPISHKD